MRDILKCDNLVMIIHYSRYCLHITYIHTVKYAQKEIMGLKKNEPSDR
jgi:hypothetical protein